MKLLTLSDLCDYYSNHKNMVTYSASKNDGIPVTVQLNGTMTFSDDEYDPEIGLLKCHLKSSHIGDNRNRSSIPKEVMEEAKASIYNRPILGFIHELSDGSYDFAGHEMKINDDGDIEYEEIPLGNIPESGDAKLVYDEDMDKTYLEVDGYVYEEYTRAADILKEKKESKVSVELCLLDYSYDPKNKLLIINKFYFSGVTILGTSRDKSEKKIEEGMLGSKITLKDFKQNNSMFSNMSKKDNSKLIETLEALNELLSKFNIDSDEKSDNTTRKEEDTIVEEKEEIKVNEEVTEKEEVTELESTEEVTETVTENESENGDVETPEVVEQEACGDDKDKEKEEFSDDTEEETPEVVEEESTEEPAEDETDDVVKEDEACGGKNKDKEKCSLDFSSVTFQLSHEDVRCALYTLLEPYCDTDNEWYWISDVFDDHFIYEGCGSKVFGQKYTKDGDTVSFDGERYELFKELLTASEKAELENLRSNYSSIESELNTYKEKELMAKKEEVLSDEAYSAFVNNEEFEEIKKNVADYTLDELKTKCELAFAKCVREDSSFAAKEEPKKERSFVAFAAREQKSSFLDGLLGKEK